MNIIRFFTQLLPVKTVYAHCDIPCGIYDPHPAQIAAHTVIRMTSLISEAKPASDAVEDRKKFVHQMARMTKVKEDHAELVEKELGTLENDYFKEEHFKAHQKLQETIAKAVKLSIKARQEVNMEAAQELLATVQQVAEIFYKTKDIKSTRVKAPYPTGLELVVPR